MMIIGNWIYVYLGRPSQELVHTLIFLGDPSEKKQPVSTFSGVSRGSLARSVKSEAKPSPGGFAGSRRLSCLANLGKNIANAFHQPTLFWPREVLIKKNLQQYFVPKNNYCPRIREALLSHLRCPFTHCLRDGPLRAPPGRKNVCFASQEVMEVSQSVSVLWLDWCYSDDEDDEDI